ncbi:fructose PTS transporter subunit IIB [Virgibacillus halophilus]|uniref:Fructose PTS transporter subunit IIB n=1 Tax=Tigheibacillus halophilus TaxID=361280 RepID=A0ABU5C2P0_9BACI|nr:fructose PTS transporter subunit IIB [Virgibacillus halophilus]
MVLNKRGEFIWKKKLAAVTNCPAGIAHTYMSAEALQREAEKRGDTMKVETQGSVGVENELTSENIAQADYIIIAAGRGMSDDELRRFNGKKVLFVDVSDVLRDVSSTMDRLEREARTYYAQDEGNDDQPTGTSAASRHKRGVAGVFQHLMNGVSFMIPFVTAGGILLAISAALVGGGKTVEGSFAYLLEQVGVIGFDLMIPILAGYTAYSIADKPALAPAMIGAWLANQADILGTKGGAGFLGAILVGLLVGYFVRWFKKFKLPKSLTPLMSFLIIPTVSTLLIAVVVFYFIGPVIAGIMLALTTFFKFYVIIQSGHHLCDYWYDDSFRYGRSYQQDCLSIFLRHGCTGKCLLFWDSCFDHSYSTGCFGTGDNDQAKFV